MTERVVESNTWVADAMLPGFESLTLHLPDDYDGPVVATLVRRRAEVPSRTAVLYVHGFIDYFFQAHLAQQVIDHGCNFYALDLRKYGRSLRADERHPNLCQDVAEYFAEISAAMSILTEAEDNTSVVLMGHSTGGLVVSLYAHGRTYRSRVSAVVLNSPFFDFNASPSTKRGLRLLGALGGLAPFLSIKPITPIYAQSLLRDYHGEWLFDTRLKPVHGFPVYFGWLRAIQRAQTQVRNGLAIACPVLVMHSDKSVDGEAWTPDFQAGDGVLNVADMRAAVSHLGPSVTEVEIRDGLHDLALSRVDVRERFFEELFGWLAEHH
jgi:alpha-beta hydrolase superfamily lysophospholipase